MVCLPLIYLLRDLDDGLHALFEITGEVWHYVCFFLEHKSGEQSNDLGGFVGCEYVVKDEFCEDQLVGGVDLAGYFAFELYSGAVVNEFEVLEDLNSLLVVWEELQILVGHQLAQLGDIFFDQPLVMAHCKL